MGASLALVLSLLPQFLHHSGLIVLLLAHGLLAID